MVKDNVEDNYWQWLWFAECSCAGIQGDNHPIDNDCGYAKVPKYFKLQLYLVNLKAI